MPLAGLTGNRMAIHCRKCGGHVVNARRAQYRVWSEEADLASPRSEPCACARPLLVIPWRGRPRHHPSSGTERDG
jgi:hypothetical protein